MATRNANSYRRSILIVNPNTTASMTDALRPIIDSLGLHETHVEYLTAPTGVPSINNAEAAAVSAAHTLPHLKSRSADYDAFLICCYSFHPLVHMLQHELATAGLAHKPVLGIMEASVATCLQLLSPPEKFGIVSTGAQWETLLASAVENVLGAWSVRYAGTETTGLNADELHSTAKVEVDARMKAAVKRLLGKGAKAICLGCAGMAGLDVVVREACVEALGQEEGKRVRIVDGVKSGVLFLDGALRAGV